MDTVPDTSSNTIEVPRKGPKPKGGRKKKADTKAPENPEPAKKRRGRKPVNKAGKAEENAAPIPSSKPLPVLASCDEGLTSFPLSQANKFIPTFGKTPKTLRGKPVSFTAKVAESHGAAVETASKGDMSAPLDDAEQAPTIPAFEHETAHADSACQENGKGMAIQACPVEHDDSADLSANNDSNEKSGRGEVVLYQPVFGNETLTDVDARDEQKTEHHERAQNRETDGETPAISILKQDLWQNNFPLKMEVFAKGEPKTEPERKEQTEGLPVAPSTRTCPGESALEIARSNPPVQCDVEEKRYAEKNSVDGHEAGTADFGNAEVGPGGDNNEITMVTSAIPTAAETIKQTQRLPIKNDSEQVDPGRDLELTDSQLEALAADMTQEPTLEDSSRSPGQPDQLPPGVRGPHHNVALPPSGRNRKPPDAMHKMKKLINDLTSLNQALLKTKRDMELYKRQCRPPGAPPAPSHYQPF